MNKVDMRLLSLKERINSFNEVALGFSLEEAKLEANRCLNCKTKPCVSGCPVNIDIPNFISCVKNDDIDGAYKVISFDSLLPEICGRVCPQETQCESKCVRGIKGEAVSIGRLERFVADNAKNKDVSKKSSDKEKVAIIGSGPSGLSCASVLALEGYDVTVYEAMHEFGGVLTYGIPEFRLPKRIVHETINKLQNIGVKFEKNVVFGKTLDVNDLKEMGYKAIFIGCGAGLPKFMGIPGENLNGVYSSNEFLTRVNLMKSFDEKHDTPYRKLGHVIVVGGGNVAMDAARCAKRCGAESVDLVYRRGFEEMPARLEEKIHAQEENINFNFLTNPTKIIGDNNDEVTEIECVKMTLSEMDASGRRKPIVLDGSEFRIKADTIIMALGNTPNPLIKDLDVKLDMNSHGCIIVDENHMTSVKGIFAGGDIVTGAATVILAMQAGKEAARSMIRFLKDE